MQIRYQIHYQHITIKLFYYEDTRNRPVSTSLYYLITRYYDPELGRYISSNGVSSLNPHNINGLNLYAFANNNPILGVYTHSIVGESAIGGTVSAIKNIPSNSSSAIHWDNQWFNIGEPEFFIFTNEGFVLLSWGVSIYTGRLYFDEAENHSLYFSIGNVSATATIDYDGDINIEFKATLFAFGYDGRVLDINFEFLSIGYTHKFEDGVFTSGAGFGLFGCTIAIDFKELGKIILEKM